MVTVTCLNRFKDTNGIIVGYRLKDCSGRIKNIKTSVLKQAIKQGEIQVTNLALTVDNRLIHTEIAQIKTVKQPLDKFKALKIFEAKAALFQIKIFDFEIEPETNRIIITKYYDEPTRTEITIPSFIDGFKSYDSKGVFSTCEHIEKITMNSNVTGSLENLFYGFRGTKLDLSDFDTTNINDMNAMFYNCRADIILGDNFDTLNVTDMSCMFSGCMSRSINLGNRFYTSNVMNMSCMFARCEAVLINLGNNFDTSNVIDISFMFNRCKAQSINLGNKFNTSKITSIRYIFAECQVKSLNLGDMFDMSSATDTFCDMFYDCMAEHIILGKHTPKSTIQRLKHVTGIPIIIKRIKE